MENVQSGLLQIETDFGNRVVDIIGQIFDRSGAISVEKIDMANVEDVQSVVGENALRVQMTWGAGPHKITLLAKNDILPNVANALAPDQEKVDSNDVLELRETLTHIFGDFSQYLSERTGQQIEIIDPKVQLWEVNKDDNILEDSYLIILNVEIDDEIHTQVCKIIPKGLENALLTEKSNVQEKPPLVQNKEPIEKVDISPTSFEQLQDTGSIGFSRNLDTLLDLELPIIVELGRVKMLLKDILDLGPGGIVELNKFSGEPVELYVNSKKFAEGEVVIIDQNFGVRITELVSQQERIASLDKQAMAG